MKNDEIKKYEYTRQALKKINQLISRDRFNTLNASDILDFLVNTTEFYSFTDYLKRYIYNRCSIDEEFDTVSDNEYMYIIKESFRKAHCPFYMNSQNEWKVSVVKNWMKSDTITREGMFHIAYGLEMTSEEVSGFLVKALQEHDFDFFDPYETVSWYCYRNNLFYKDALRLLEKAYKKTKCNCNSITTILKQPSLSLINEDRLIDYVAYLHLNDVPNETNNKRKKVFDQLLFELKSSIYQSAYLLSPDKHWATIEKVSLSEIERIICAGIPIDENGKHLKQKDCILYNKIRTHKISRQRLGKLIKGETYIRRSEIIQLQFFIVAINHYGNHECNLVDLFIREINKKLNYCGYEKLYLVNVYEAFIVLCLNTAYPMEIYEDVLELSYITNR